jgi:hypothetical protein
VSTARTTTDIRVVPDLGEELLAAIDRLEGLLSSLALWEKTDGVVLPEPFAGHRVLTALETVGRVVRPTQARGGPQLVSGRLPRRGWNGRRLPLRFVPIGDAPLAVLEHGMHVLAVHRAYPALNAAVERYAAVLDEPHLTILGWLSRTVSVLTLPWDDDIEELWASATAYPSKCDTELSRSEQQAYDRVVRRIDQLWSYGPGGRR